jgi:hypothetical protein
VEQDQGDSEVEEQLGAHPVERVRDQAQHGRANNGSHGDEHDHLRYPQKRRDELRDETAAQYDAEAKENLLDVHG